MITLHEKFGIQIFLNIRIIKNWGYNYNCEFLYEHFNVSNKRKINQYIFFSVARGGDTQTTPMNVSQLCWPIMIVLKVSMNVAFCFLNLGLLATMILFVNLCVQVPSLQQDLLYGITWQPDQIRCPCKIQFNLQQTI